MIDILARSTSGMLLWKSTRKSFKTINSSVEQESENEVDQAGLEKSLPGRSESPALHPVTAVSGSLVPRNGTWKNWTPREGSR